MHSRTIDRSEIYASVNNSYYALEVVKSGLHKHINSGSFALISGSSDRS